MWAKSRLSSRRDKVDRYYVRTTLRACRRLHPIVLLSAISMLFCETNLYSDPDNQMGFLSPPDNVFRLVLFPHFTYLPPFLVRSVDSVCRPKRPLVFRCMLSEIHAMPLCSCHGKVFVIDSFRTNARRREFKDNGRGICEKDISDSVVK